MLLIVLLISRCDICLCNVVENHIYHDSTTLHRTFVTMIFEGIHGRIWLFLGEYDFFCGKKRRH